MIDIISHEGKEVNLEFSKSFQKNFQHLEKGINLQVLPLK